MELSRIEAIKKQCGSRGKAFLLPSGEVIYPWHHYGEDGHVLTAEELSGRMDDKGIEVLYEQTQQWECPDEYK